MQKIKLKEVDRIVKVVSTTLQDLQLKAQNMSLKEFDDETIGDTIYNLMLTYGGDANMYFNKELNEFLNEHYDISDEVEKMSDADWSILYDRVKEFDLEVVSNVCGIEAIIGFKTFNVLSAFQSYLEKLFKDKLETKVIIVKIRDDGKIVNFNRDDMIDDAFDMRDIYYDGLLNDLRLFEINVETDEQVMNDIKEGEMDWDAALDYLLEYQKIRNDVPITGDEIIVYNSKEGWCAGWKKVPRYAMEFEDDFLKEKHIIGLEFEQKTN